MAVSRSRVPMVGWSVLVMAVAAAGCGSASDPPPPRPIVTVAPPAPPHTPRSAPPPSTTPAPVPSAPRLCRAPGTLTELSVTRLDAFPKNQVSFVFPPFVTSSDAAAVAAVARAACALPDFPPGAYSCPLDYGVTYSLVFRSGSVDVGAVTADPTGCPTLTGLGPTRAADPPFWAQLAVALGLPAPREFCDAFCGRLPGAPTQCGPAL